MESKCDTNEHIYKIKTDSQIHRTDLWLPRVGERWGKDWEFGINTCKLCIYIGWINKIPLYNIANYIQYPVIKP